MIRKPELLMPAGSLDVLKTAFYFGADAVYIGGDMYGLRAKAHNFSEEEMREGIEYAHSLGKKVYVTVNITAHNSDIEGIKEYMSQLKDMKPDGLIISDPGVFEIAEEYAPELERHISTQANNVNYLTYKFWYNHGAKRIVSARELSLKEIKEIRENIPENCEIESFIHGAMCISYSGRCLLSNYLVGRDANLGACTHPCRWKYFLMEEKRPGEFFPVEENDRGTYIFNSKDLCMVDHIPEIVDAGINSLKVEGRMKTALYVATVARAYRHAIDTYFDNPEEYRKNIPLYFDEIHKCTNRHFTTGFYFGKPSEDAQVYGESTYVKDFVYLGTIEATREYKAENGQKVTECLITQKNKFCTGDVIEVITPASLDKYEVKVLDIKNEAGEHMESCPHASERVYITIAGEASTGDIFRVGPKEE